MKLEAALGQSSMQDLKRARKLHSRKLYEDWRTRTKESKIYLCVLFALAEGKCPRCGVYMFLSFNNEHSPNKATLDHIEPLSETMEHTKLGLQIMCLKCNKLKGYETNSIK